MKFKKIRKRDGRIEEFNAEKITNAIAKAGAATQEFGRDVAKKLTIKVLSLAEEVIKSDIPTVEEIQDIVEEVLITSPYKKTAKAYIIYRDQHAKIREIVERSDVRLVDQYLQKLDWQVRENSNMTFSLQGLNNYISSQISKIYWLNKIYPPEVKKAHVDGDFHIHDLNLLAVYTYYGKEVVVARFNGQIKLISLEQLYEIVDENEVLLSMHDDAHAKYPRNLFVLDRGGFTRVTRIVKKRRDRKMRFIKNMGGRSIIVTEDHPMITDKGEKIASEVPVNEDKTLNVDIKLLLEGEKLFFKSEIDMLEEMKKRERRGGLLYNGVRIEMEGDGDDGILRVGKFTIRRKIALSEEFGYFVGLAIACAHDREDALPPWKDVYHVLSDLGIEDEGYNAMNPFLRFLFDEVFMINNLPVDILQYNIDFIRGLIRGIFDRMIESEMSRTLREQLNIVISLIAARCAHYDVFRTGELCELSTASAALRDGCENWHIVIKNEEIDISDDFIYDVTTESGTLVVNGMWNHNCVGWDLYDLLLKGFGGVPGKIESKPARHFRSALGHVVNFFYTLQGEAAGAQAFSNFDTLLAPFIRHDGLSEKDVEQALQEFVFNINVPTRVGFQTPFTNVTLDVDVPPTLQDTSVIIGGEPQNLTYADFQEEMDMFNRAFLRVLLEGDAAGRVFTFPIPTYNITRNFRWDDECAELLWKVAAKYGIPYFSNFINSDMRPEDARAMCCRLRLELDKLERRGGGLFGASPMTGSIGVVTINMPRLGYLSADEDAFFDRLHHLMRLASQALEIKRKVLERFTERDLYPYSKYYLRSIKEHLGAYWKNHFSTIGLVGMNECCLNLIGEDIASVEGRKFTLRTLDFMRSLLIEFQEETGNLYNLEATPAEGCSYRLALLDKERFADIICANEEAYKRGAEPFYTNSSQLPVNYTDDVFEALELQEEIQTKYTGGTVFHVYVGEQITDSSVVRRLVRKICENFRIPYFTITPTFSVCAAHGYIAGEHERCPRCGRECEVYSRVVGYLRPVSQWNAGKQEEFKMRRTFRIHA